MSECAHRPRTNHSIAAVKPIEQAMIGGDAGHLIDTLELLDNLNARIFESFNTSGARVIKFGNRRTCATSLPILEVGASKVTYADISSPETMLEIWA